MRRVVLILLSLAVAVPAFADRLTLVCLDVGRAVDACREVADAFSAETEHQVRVVTADPSGREALAQYVNLFSVGSPRLDVVQFPATWLPAIASDLEDLGPPDDPERFVPATLEGGTWRSRMVGWPQHLAINVLYVRADLMNDLPARWLALREGLLSIGDDKPSGLAFGGGDPVLFPFVLDWLHSFGTKELDNVSALRFALQAMNEAVGTVTSSGVAATTTKQAVNAFSEGRAAALIAPSTVNGIAISGAEEAMVAATTLPTEVEEGVEVQTLASVWYVGISAASSNKESARALAKALVATEAQRKAALEFGLAPTLTDLYDDGDVLAASPVFDLVAARLAQLVGVPVKQFRTDYLDVADTVSEAVRAMLRGEANEDVTASLIARAVRRNALDGS
ncbi:MAG: extracellular solute-binding protein [Pseudomonadota bacterium]